jgi:hypothetical protein
MQENNMRENVKLLFYANKSGSIMDKGHLPAQLGCAAMVKVWVESNIIDRFDLWKDADVNVHYIEGRGYIIELELVQWTFCEPDTPMYKFKTTALQFIEDFGLKNANTLAACDYGMEVVTLSRDGRKYGLHQHGNHMYGVDVKHTVEVAHSLMQPISIGDSDWIEENRHGV